MHVYQQILNEVATYLPPPIKISGIEIKPEGPSVIVFMGPWEGEYTFATMELEKHVLSKNGTDTLYNPLNPRLCVGDVSMLNAAWAGGKAKPPKIVLHTRADLWLRRVAMMAVSDMMLNYRQANTATGDTDANDV